MENKRLPRETDDLSGRARATAFRRRASAALSRIRWIDSASSARTVKPLNEKRIIEELRWERSVLEQSVAALTAEISRLASAVGAAEARAKEADDRAQETAADLAAQQEVFALAIAAQQARTSALSRQLAAIECERDDAVATAGALQHQVVAGLFALLLERAPTKKELHRFVRRIMSGAEVESVAADMLLLPDGRKLRKNRERFARLYAQRYPFPLLEGIERAMLPIHVVDVGAQLLSGPALTMEHVYQRMFDAGSCQVIGFEPLMDEAERRMQREPNVKILPYFIGNGEEATFHINAYSPTSSLLPSNPEAMEKFKGLATVLPTVKTEPAVTTRLDDVPELSCCDYLKIDVQGFELSVLRGAPRLLGATCAIHLEVEHEAIYQNQPLFAEIDTHLRNSGFELIDLLAPGYETYRDGPADFGESRLLWNDALYVKRDNLMTDEMLLKAAYIAHVNYGKYDMAAHLLAVYDRRAKTSLAAAYRDALAAKK
jgi:FkbM family methyltransferase